MLRSVLSYEKDKIVHSSKLIIPLLFLFIYFAVAYSTAPLNILKSYSLCSLVVYLFMLCVGVVNDDMNYSTIDQTILVKMRHKSFFYLGKAALMIIISFAVSIASVLIPLLINLIQQNHLFTRSVVISDVVSGFALFWLIGMSGGISGLYANRRIIPNRKAAVALSALCGILVIIKGPLVKAIPGLIYITWIFPPVHDLSVAYSDRVYFGLDNTLVYFVWLAAYTIIEIAAYTIIMLRRKFE